jgi:predicted aspartyl protease
MADSHATDHPDRPVEVFYAYSHKDERLRDKLETHLSILKRNRVISGWHDRRISAGMGWTGKIDDKLNRADLILLLVSADFIASDYCYDKEMMRAMERHERGEARVIPVILRPCDCQGAPFGKLQGLPRDMKAVTSWTSRDEAFKCIAIGVGKAAEELRAAKLTMPSNNAGESVRGASVASGKARARRGTAMPHRAQWRPDSSTLLQQGPHIAILISRTPSELGEAKAAGLDLKELPVRALIDTGASLTLINPQIAATCQLTQTGNLKINAIGGEAGEFQEYAAAISFPGTDLPRLDLVRVVACPIIRQPHFACILGRDILRNWLLAYDGLNGKVEIRAR